jgi:putative protease
VTRVWRAALDRLHAAPSGWRPDESWQRELTRLAEGRQTTLGPYHRSWH